MEKREPQLPDHSDCLNCGSSLRGQYCGRCGQRATSRLISLWELLREGFGDLLDVDSRLWRTMTPLLIRPGQLTRDYLMGRRARYMPPFRMYLVLSVIFFVVAFFDPKEDLGLLFEPEPQPAPEEQQKEDDEPRDAALEKIAELEADGVLSEEKASEARAAIADKDGDGPNIRIYSDGEDKGFNFEVDQVTGECAFSGHDRMPEWMQRRLTVERLEESCERISADGGKLLGSMILDNIPVALIVLLPVMALVLKGLYPLSRRYFVEHLLFFVHFHSFFFLILTVQIVFSRLANLVFVPEVITVLIVIAAAFYVPVYLYKAMRLVYGQGHIATLVKYIALSAAYFVGASLTMMGAMIVALLTV
jgi:hypothetical protein